MLGALELLLQSDEVDGVARIGEAGHGLEDQAVRAAVEILVDHPFGDPIPGLVVQHQAAQYGLFGLKRVGRYFQLLCLGVFFAVTCSAIHIKPQREGDGNFTKETPPSRVLIRPVIASGDKTGPWPRQRHPLLRRRPASDSTRKGQTRV